MSENDENVQPPAYYPPPLNQGKTPVVPVVPGETTGPGETTEEVQEAALSPQTPDVKIIHLGNIKPGEEEDLRNEVAKANDMAARAFARQMELAPFISIIEKNEQQKQEEKKILSKLKTGDFVRLVARPNIDTYEFAGATFLYNLKELVQPGDPVRIDPKDLRYIVPKAGGDYKDPSKFFSGPFETILPSGGQINEELRVKPPTMRDVVEVVTSVNDAKIEDEERMIKLFNNVQIEGNQLRAKLYKDLKKETENATAKGGKIYLRFLGNPGKQKFYLDDLVTYFNVEEASVRKLIGKERKIRMAFEELRKEREKKMKSLKSKFQQASLFTGILKTSQGKAEKDFEMKQRMIKTIANKDVLDTDSIGEFQIMFGLAEEKQQKIYYEFLKDRLEYLKGKSNEELLEILRDTPPAGELDGGAQARAKSKEELIAQIIKRETDKIDVVFEEFRSRNNDSNRDSIIDTKVATKEFLDKLVQRSEPPAQATPETQQAEPESVAPAPAPAPATPTPGPPATPSVPATPPVPEPAAPAIKQPEKSEEPTREENEDVMRVAQEALQQIKNFEEKLEAEIEKGGVVEEAVDFIENIPEAAANVGDTVFVAATDAAADAAAATATVAAAAANKLQSGKPAEEAAAAAQPVLSPPPMLEGPSYADSREAAMVVGDLIVENKEQSAKVMDNQAAARVALNKRLEGRVKKGGASIKKSRKKQRRRATKKSMKKSMKKQRRRSTKKSMKKRRISKRSLKKSRKKTR